jgi:hypothetical protein
MLLTDSIKLAEVNLRARVKSAGALEKTSPPLGSEASIGGAGAARRRYQ